MQTKLFGIRHHGSGTARHLLAELHAFQPDQILIEGPPEADGLLSQVCSAEMQPPVALLAYQADNPSQAVYYPFAEFSPEWQALCYAERNGVAVNFFDLPLAHSLALKQPKETAETDDKTENDDAESTVENVADFSEKPTACYRHPFDEIAELAGFTDGEQFWEAMVEQRADGTDLFEAVNQLIAELRIQYPERTSEEDLLREAYMRKMLRQVEKEGKAERVAVICGAWHVPALQAKIAAKDDNALLKGLPKVKVECTWIAWTNSRLTYTSGYGAGIQAPNWYQHLWQQPDDDGVLWLSQAAALLREQQFDVSPAHVIEAQRLAQASAALRGLPKAGLQDYLDAVIAVFAMGEPLILQRISQRWLVGDNIGTVPSETPQLPLISDVEKWRKQVRLPVTAEIKEQVLDLRKPLDLQRSLFIHRLNLLGIDWATPVALGGKGTFKEAWQLYYQPEHHILLTEKAVFGNTLDEAVCRFVESQIQQASQLSGLAALLRHVMPADLPQLVERISQGIERLSVDNQDLSETLQAIPHLAETLSYGSVREFDVSPLKPLLMTLLIRLTAGGEQGCMQIDEETAETLFQQIRQADYQLSLLDDEQANAHWSAFLQRLADNGQVHSLLRGNAVRAAFDKQKIDLEQTALLFRQNLSTANRYSDAAYWLQGFLYESGTVLLLQEELLGLINEWLGSLSEEIFIELLPLIRRTFSTFEKAERRQIGEKLLQKNTPNRPLASPVGELNHEGGERAMQTIFYLLGSNECKTQS